MIPVIVLRLGALMATAGITPGTPVSPGNIFRVDQPAGSPVLFKVN